LGRIINYLLQHSETFDREGLNVFACFINAHDHLELNHYPRTKFRERYPNAHEWGEDVNTHLHSEPYATLRKPSFWDKAFIGALKNLLCGATQVIQHGDPKPELFQRDFPIKVLRSYGWTHSLHFSTPEQIQKSYHKTPKHQPFFIHLAEGTDEIASREYQQLKALGCVQPNTLLIHGVGMTEADIQDARQQGVWLITCPTTNDYLLGATANTTAWGENLLIGSDSRLTADGDLLNEIQRLGHYPQASHPLIAFQNTDYFLASQFPTQRNQIELIVKDNHPQIGSPRMMAKFPKVQSIACMLDGIEKRISLALAKSIHQCKLKESEFEIEPLPKRIWFRFWNSP
jgi:hypothetical protein